MAKEKITALYERLSREDEKAGESNSISHQKEMLEDFARKNRFPNPVHFSDDGWSGTNFERPQFNAMIREIEAGNVQAVITKDLSRLGRDSRQIANYMELFRTKRIPLITLADSIDTTDPDGDGVYNGQNELIITVLNMVNEQYVRDTSQKIKSVFRHKGMSGKHLTGTVIYGYLWDENRENWIVDEEAAEVVRRIFNMTMAGYGPYQIAEALRKDGVEIPSVHLARYNEGVNKHKAVKDPCGWGSSVVVNILKKREYLGHTVSFKTRKHFKDKKSHYVDESQWVIFENTHEPIITQELYDNVQRIRANVRRYPNGWGEAAPLTGLLYCADCGSKMYVHRVNNGKRVSQYTCSAYSKIPVGELCPTQHRIAEKVVLDLVAAMLRAIMEFSKVNREEFIRTVQNAQDQNQDSDIRRKKSRLATAKKRTQDIDKLLLRSYEDLVLGKLPEDRYEKMNILYNEEQTALTEEIKELERAIASYNDSLKGAQKFIALVDKYQDFQELTVTMLNEFVEKILVHERAEKGKRDTTQDVDIYFNFIGQYIPPTFKAKELTPEEQEAKRQTEERREKYHQAYLQRKASGSQKRYEDKVKAAKKAEMDAKKDAIRAEDIANGVFTPVKDLPKQEPRRAGEDMKKC